jgi:hypothetical protein
VQAYKGLSTKPYLDGLAEVLLLLRLVLPLCGGQAGLQVRQLTIQLVKVQGCWQAGAAKGKQGSSVESSSRAQWASDEHQPGTQRLHAVRLW